MGNLVGLYRDTAGFDYFLDFEALDNEPLVGRGDADVELLQECLRCKAQIHGALEAVNAYTGCADVIRHSMSAPGDHSAQRAAFDALLPNVERIASFHATSQTLAALLPRLLLRLSELHTIVDRPQLVRQVVAMLAYVLEWDQAKMMRPQIQNDFAFYKRLMPRMVASSDYTLEQLTVSDRHAGTISMFIAENMPLTVALSTALRDNTTASRTANIIAQVANLCCGTVARADGYRQDATLRQLLLGMTSAVVLYDRITIEGVFARGGGVGVSLRYSTCSCLKYALRVLYNRITIEGVFARGGGVGVS
eukprot:TRINITY_DN2008_c0_g1_i1.p1 TRINITY_DN2008_c0_g1~~TRINITY_DN2008_c0_g1_i1.p1  ORF type:complete len:307 (-),score=57.19 TRINITY_DN2008_c0_g1_i1:1051-1971(-)